MDNTPNHGKTSADHLKLARLPRIAALIAISITGLIPVGASAAAVAARVASVKGSATISGEGRTEEALRAGSTVRSGAVITTGAQSGALLRPAPKVSVVIFMSTKVRFDGADLDSQGRGGVNCSVISGRIMVLIDPEAGSPEAQGKVKVGVTTEQGVIIGTRGTWTVRHDEDRTVVAVSQGKTDVSVGGNSSSSTTATGTQIEVPSGSVIWLQKRGDGLVEAKVVNTETGTMVTVQPDGSRTSSKAPADLLDQSKDYLNDSGDGTLPGPPKTPSEGDTPTKPPSNPDFSNPKPVLPVVSADTP